MSTYPKQDQRFCAGVLALPACPKTPVKAREYLRVFLEARAELKSGGRQPKVVGRGKPRRRTAPVPNGDLGDGEELNDAES